MWGLVGALSLLLAAIVAARAFGLPFIQPWTRHFSTLQAFLTITAVMLAAVWYFFERPQAAKLDLAQTVQAVPLEPGRVLLLIEVSPKNLGGAALDFSKSPYAIEVGQVTPLTMTPYREGLEPPGPDKVRRLRNAEQWSPLARIAYAVRDDQGRLAPNPQGEPLTSFIEAGETENLYFRVILPCKPLLRVYVVSRFEKPLMFWEEWRDAPRITWVKQTFVDLSPHCPAAPLPAQPTPKTRKRP